MEPGPQPEFLYSLQIIQYLFDLDPESTMHWTHLPCPVLSFNIWLVQTMQTLNSIGRMPDLCAFKDIFSNFGLSTLSITRFPVASEWSQSHQAVQLFLHLHQPGQEKEDDDVYEPGVVLQSLVVHEG